MRCNKVCSKHRVIFHLIYASAIQLLCCWHSALALRINWNCDWFVLCKSASVHCQSGQWPPVSLRVSQSVAGWVSVMTPNCVTWMKGPRGGSGEGGTDFTISQSSSHRGHRSYLASDWSADTDGGLWLADPVRAVSCPALLSCLCLWPSDSCSGLLGPNSDLKFKSSKHHLPTWPGVSGLRETI